MFIPGEISIIEAVRILQLSKLNIARTEIEELTIKLENSEREKNLLHQKNEQLQKDQIQELQKIKENKLGLSWAKLRSERNWDLFQIRERSYITSSTFGQFWTPPPPLRHQDHHGSGPPTPPKMMM